MYLFIDALAASAGVGAAPRRPSIAASAPRQRAPTPTSSAARAWCRSTPKHPSWPNSARLPTGHRLRDGTVSHEPSVCSGRAASARDGTHLSWKSASLQCSWPRRTCMRANKLFFFLLLICGHTSYSFLCCSCEGKQAIILCLLLMRANKLFFLSCSCKSKQAILCLLRMQEQTS